jgi:hypothetical protein
LPPHRVVDSAFHLTGVLLRKHSIANYRLRVNLQCTELQKIIGEFAISCSERLKILQRLD